MAKIKREAFSVVRYKLNASQLNKAIEMYLNDMEIFVAPDANYEINVTGATVTSWFPEVEK